MFNLTGMINFYHYSAMYFSTQTINQLCNEQYLHRKNSQLDISTRTCNFLWKRLK